ncbi:MAG: DUF1616 domain-containing protein [Candidatus Bathyarchaeia archaeon]|jgi:uncharacterized membrane protein
MKPVRWLEIILLITAMTMLCTYVIPAESPVAFLRYALGIFFVFLVPGNCLVNILFRKRNKLDLIEEAVLSVALSFGVAGIVGLFLGLSPIGLNFTSITVSLTGVTLVLAALAYILTTKDANHPEQQATSFAKTATNNF